MSLAYLLPNVTRAPMCGADSLESLTLLKEGFPLVRDFLETGKIDGISYYGVSIRKNGDLSAWTGRQVRGLSPFLEGFWGREGRFVVPAGQWLGVPVEVARAVGIFQHEEKPIYMWGDWESIASSINAGGGTSCMSKYVQRCKAFYDAFGVECLVWQWGNLSFRAVVVDGNLDRVYYCHGSSPNTCGTGEMIARSLSLVLHGIVKSARLVDGWGMRDVFSLAGGVHRPVITSNYCAPDNVPSSAPYVDGCLYVKWDGEGFYLSNDSNGKVYSCDCTGGTPSDYRDSYSDAPGICGLPSGDGHEGETLCEDGEYYPEDECVQVDGDWYHNESDAIRFCDSDGCYHLEDEVGYCDGCSETFHTSSETYITFTLRRVHHTLCSSCYETH